jgi:predicted MFS family arabinose efflux permease
VAVGALSVAQSTVVVGVALFLFGMAFVVWQSTMVATVQDLLPDWRGVAMPLASFAMSTGGGFGAWVNGRILAGRSLEAVYVLAASILLVAGLIGARVIPIPASAIGTAPVARHRGDPETAWIVPRRSGRLKHSEGPI